MSILVGLCGGPSSGKTCLGRALANHLNLKGYNAEYVPEYAREHIAQCDRSLFSNPRDLLHQAVILLKQIEREDAVPEVIEYVVSDSPIIMHSVYSYMMANLEDYNHKTFYLHHYQTLLENRHRYGYLFYLPSGDIEFKADGLRKQDVGRAYNIGERIKAFLVFHNLDFHEVTGSVEERVQKCSEILLAGR